MCLLEPWSAFLDAGLGGLLILSIDLITEQGPAISLAYEPAEARVMDRPPRDNAKDRLVDGSLLRYSYLVYGLITVCSAYRRCLAALLLLQLPLPLLLGSSHQSLRTTHTRVISWCCQIMPVYTPFTCPLMLCLLLKTAGVMFTRMFVALQATICMIAFFTIFWWNGVPLALVYNHGATHWMADAPDLVNCRSGSQWLPSLVPRVWVQLSY